MKAISLTLLLALAAGCAGSPVPQPDPPPPRMENAGRLAPDARTPTDEQATEQWLEAQTATQGGTVDSRQRVRGRTPTDESATDAWLEQEQERRRYVPPAPPPPQVVERIVVETPNYPYYGDPYYGGYREPQPTTPFPYYTASGAALGAAIGSTSCQAGEGAAIGAGVGLFLDLVRWH